MTKEEFLKRCKEDEDWTPGWEALDNVFDSLYPGQEPAHYGTNITARAIFGGDEYLDGYSYYASPKGYCHLLTYGMTELYQEEEMFGGEFNRWGYEMTMKLKGTHEENAWAMQLLGHLAKYTYEQERFFEPLQYVSIDVRGLVGKENSKMAGFLIVNDSEAQTINTIYGEVMFLQLTTITENELSALIEDRTKAEALYNAMKADNPDFVVDFEREKDYI